MSTLRTGARRPPPEAAPIEDSEACREEALKLLDRQRRPRADLARRLGEKGYATATIVEVLERLAAVGLVDDVEFARAFLAGRWGRRPSGWRRLQQELRAKGIAEPDVVAARALIEQREGGVDELSTARKLLAQVAHRYARLEPRVREQRLWALLARRGFDRDVIRRALALSDDEGEVE
ncbi:MAG: regulatory protein RecX [Candidatus Eisenbacteria bacterium]|nr:regulatory protein RecX [Candidatus Eisenbacteria bacterium]